MNRSRRRSRIRIRDKISSRSRGSHRKHRLSLLFAKV